MKIWSQKTTDEYLSGLPIGTGRLAAMVLGEADNERVGLNHEWLWRGPNRHREPPKAAHLLAGVRELLLAGNYADGTTEGNEAFGGPGGIRQKEEPNRVDPYQPAGDLYIRLNHGAATDYRRELDLDNATLLVSYRADGNDFRREYLAHLDHDVILVRVSASEQFSGTFHLTRTEDPEATITTDVKEDGLTLHGEFPEGIYFLTRAQLVAGDGQRSVVDGALSVEGAYELVFALNVGTSTTVSDATEECAPFSIPENNWQSVRDSHLAAYEPFYKRMTLTLDMPEPDVATDERIQAVRDGGADPHLPSLYFNYGRYLLIVTTVNALLPPNLQGKWNEDLNPPWSADYHHDINLQMNHWPAETANLADAVEPLLTYVERLVPHAKRSAKDLYGCRGVWYPIQTDPWGPCTPESCGWAVWIGAAPWLAQHMWWHYEYGQDVDYLRERAYPFFKEVAEFYEDYLIEDGEGGLQIVPSQSPENPIVGGGDWPVTLCVSATMDILLATDALNYAIRSAELLDIDPEQRLKWAGMLEKLPDLKIGSHGQLLEWNEEFEEKDPAHRHLSHLIGVYPGDSLNPETTPELWRAAEVSLDMRLKAGGGHTGWSRSWVACLYARLGRAEDAWDHMCHLITDFTTDTLLDLYPPRIFQIDGNFGGTVAVLEMLLQRYSSEIHLLPALPKAWPEGSVENLRARGSFEVSLSWRASKLTGASITAAVDGPCVLMHAAGRYTVKDADGAATDTAYEGHRVRFDAKAGSSYTVVPIG